MAADPDISVMTIGAGGVDVDSDPILTADNALLQGQNATYDPTLSRGGALTKRPGLDRFNTVSFGAPILGGIEAPFAGTAGAPISGGGGGGLPGDPGGTSGEQPPLPGGTFYGVGPGSTITVGSNAASTGVSSGALIFTTGSPLFGGKKLVVIGRADNGVSGASGAGWFVTSKGFNDPAVLLTGASGASGLGIPMNGPTIARLVGGVQAGTAGQTANHDQVIGMPPSVTEGLCARPNGVLFYAERSDPTQTSGAFTPTNFPTIRRNDGRSDVRVATIPTNPGWPLNPTGPGYATGHGMAIVGMGTKGGDGGEIYAVVHDRLSLGGVAPTNDGVRVFRLDVGTSALTELFNSNPVPLNQGNYLPVTGTASPFLSGGGIEAWFGGVNEATGVSSHVYGLVASPGFNDGYANWTGFEGTFADKGDVTCLAIYNGDLYVGHSNTAATPAFAVINVNPIALNNTSGNPVLTASGGSATAGNHFCSMAVFKGTLYVSYWNRTQIAKIYACTGTVWSTVYTSGTNGGDQVPMNLQVDSDGDILYAFGCVDGTPPAFFMTSVDGVTWVNKSANFPGGSNFPMNVFADFTQ